MASTYSTNLKIELMGTGENSGTWGTITNTNLGTAFEQAVIGLGNPDYTSDANLTITLTNSNAAQAARALVLNVTSAFGSLTATRELIVPTIQKQYIVQNNTTGGQSITVKTSAGTGITVPNGRKAHLYVDGTNVIQMFDFVDINGGTIDGATVGAASASTGAFTSLTASGATTLNGAVALGDASGDLITVPGTVNSNLLFTDATYDIGASGATRPRDMFLSRNLTVGGTLTLAGGVNLNGNVTVGDSSADTLTINATITSNLLFTDNTYDIGASGATRPRNLFLAGNATIGGAQTLTGALTVDSTTDSSSTTTGSIQTDGGVGIAKALYVGTTATIAGLTSGNVTFAGTGGLLSGSSNLFWDNTNGRLGIRTTSPQDILHIASVGASGSATARLQGNQGSDGQVGVLNFSNRTDITGGYIIGSIAVNRSGDDNSGAMIFSTAASASTPSERARITREGDVGIGTSSPGAKLNVVTASTATNQLRITSSDATAQLRTYTTSDGDGLIINHYYAVSGSPYLRSADFVSNINDIASTMMRFFTKPLSANPVEALRIDSSQNVGIGTTSPLGRVDSSYNITSFEGGQFVASNVNKTNYASITAVNGQTYSVIQTFNSSVAAGALILQPTAGSVGIGTTSPATYGKLAVNGSIYGIGGNALGVGNSDNTNFSYLINSGATGANNANMTFNMTNKGELMRLTSDGDLGVGTTAPSARIQSAVSRTSGSNTTALILSDNVTGAQTSGFGTQIRGLSNGGAAVSAIGFEASGGTNNDTAISFYTQATAGALTRRAIINRTGQMGVGNFAPYENWGNSYVSLQVQSIARTLAATGAGAGDLTLAFNAVYDSSNNRWEFAGTGDKAGRYSQTGSGESHVWYVTNTNGTADAAITFTQAMTLDSLGNLLVGRTSVPTFGDTTGSGFAFDKTFKTTFFVQDAPTAYACTYFNATSYTSGTAYFAQFRVNGATVGNITTNGTITSYDTTSDYRLKNTIAPMTGALAKVALLKPCTYKWNVNGSDGEGFIAHELQAVVPECVTGEKDAVDVEGKPKYQGIDTSFLVATLTAAIQEQQTIIESLKARLDAANL